MNLLLKLLLNSVALMLTAYFVPGFHVADFKVAVVAAIVLGVINTFIKPLLLILTAPINFLTLGLFTFVVNAVVLWLATIFVSGLVIDSFLSAIVAALLLSVISTILSILAKDLVQTAKPTPKKKR